MFSKGVEIENIVICLLLRRLDKVFRSRLFLELQSLPKMASILWREDF